MNEEIKIIFEPELPEWERIRPPKVWAGKYRIGTIVEDGDGIQWEAYFDTQDHEAEWRRKR